MDINQLPECDYCDETEGIIKIGDSLTCPTHRDQATIGEDNNQAHYDAIKNRETITPAIEVNEVLRQTKAIDTAVAVRTDLFTAETIAIDTIKVAILGDDTITNKPYALAQAVHARYTKYKEVIFEHQQLINEETNKQRAAQIYLNNLSNQLRADEREKLKIADINYKPRAVAMKVTPKAQRLVKARIDVKELRMRAAELGIPEFTFKMILIQKHLTVEAAYQMFKANIDAAKAKSNPPPVTVVETPISPDAIDDGAEVVDMSNQE